MQKKLGRNTVALLGVGHTNAHVLRMWKMKPLPNTQLVCVTDFPIATYSGMLPGVLAGQYPVEAMEIDLVRLCNSVGARLIVGTANGLDLENHRLLFANRPPLSFELLSIGIGSRPSFAGVEIDSDASLVAVKPMQTFLARFRDRFAKMNESRIAIVGGGVGSIEIAFCLQHRLKTDPQFAPSGNGSTPEIVLVTGSDNVGAGLRESTVAKVRERLATRGIEVRTRSRVKCIRDNSLELVDESTLDAGLVIWATDANAPPLLAQLGLETDKGFLATRPTLQTVSDDRVFAVGDTGTIVGSNTAKAGVYAVRQGPVLWRNIRRALENRPLESYQPQKNFLKLINTGDDHAIAEYLGRSFYGEWCWKLKNRIDVKFMKMYQDYNLMKMKPEPVDEETAMRCLGCGGKIGSELLSQVISELDLPPNENVIIGLADPDDAAIVRTVDNQVTLTTDFFAAPFDDPYVVGRIAALNSASDCFAMGAQPTAALAMVQLPVGHPRGQLQVMRELMAGSSEELFRMGAAIVGGHSIEGPRTMIGFTIVGQQIAQPKIKGDLHAGDQLVLTKPIGTGVLLAALMQSKLNGNDYLGLIETMLQSNQIALQLVKEFSISAITDVTGFGLAGHLAEMLLASRKSAEVSLSKIPVLNGCTELINAGIESSLAESNRTVAGKIEIVGVNAGEKEFAPLFDPQTGGGLLFGISPAHSESALAFLHDAGFERAIVIGEVCDVEGKSILTVRNR